MNKNNTNDSLASTFLDIDWSPKPYEIVFFVFGAITTILLWMTPLPFSYRLGAVFVMKVLDLIGFVYALSIAVIAYRAIKLGRTKGWSALRDKNVILELIQPYWTLNYLALTFRRGFAVLGVVFFSCT